MRSVRLHLTIPGKPSAEVYEVMSDLGHDLGWAPDPIPVLGGDPGGWEVGFRHGLLHWVTDCEPGRQDRAVSVFDGSWSCVDDGPGTAVTFAARFDLGDPGAEAETLAVRALIDDAVGVVAGMFEGDIRVDDVVIQPTRPAALSIV
ncbi:MAG: hypothetical protein ACRDZ8_07530 [Acidimicrobiales bacterium]